MRLVARAVLWLHVTLYRLTNGRIGGRFIAGSPILLLTTTGRRTPHPSRLVPQPGRDRPGRDPGRPPAPFCQRQDRRPDRAQSAVSPVRGDVPGLWRL
jgi:hypothetical protein